MRYKHVDIADINSMREQCSRPSTHRILHQRKRSARLGAGYKIVDGCSKRSTDDCAFECANSDSHERQRIQLAHSIDDADTRMVETCDVYL